MKRLGTFWMLLCISLGYLNEFTEADPNENFEAFAGASAEYMTSEVFEGILETLQNRLPSLKACFDHEKFHDLVPHGGQLSKEGFFNVSRAIVNIIANEQCSGPLDISTIPGGHAVAERLRHLSYHGLHSNTNCFSEDTLIAETGDGRTTAVVLNIYKGNCLLPEKDFFKLEYMKFFSDSAGNSTKQSFINMVTQLGIGELQSHDGHDHGTHDSHDHEDHDGTDTDHSSEHDHDHDGGNATGTDHDNEHNHGNATDTDHDHDHDHDHDGGNATGTDHDNEDNHGNATDTDTDHDHDHDHDHDQDHDGGNATDTDTDHDDDHDVGNATDTDHDHDHDHHGTNDTHSDHGSEDDDHDDHHSNATLFTTAASDHEHHDEDDHAHNRRRRSSHEDEAPRCYAGDQLADIYGLGNTISEAQAFEICPALIQQILSGACNSTEDSHEKERTGYTEAMIYGYGTLSVTLISLLAAIGLLLFPALETKGYKMTMQFFIGLAIGTMASDALIHIIPKVLGVHDHGAHDDHNHATGEEDMTFIWKMSLVMGGLYVVFVFENLLKVIKRSRQAQVTAGAVNRNTEKLDGNGTSVEDEAPMDDLTEKKLRAVSKSTIDSETMLNEEDIVCWFFNPTLITVFLGDILHNIADGLAIGVAFATHWSTGISTSLAILCHELPHEFGDFAIYLRNGATKWKAIGLNLTAAFSGLIGLYAGINMARDEEARNWLLCIIAGIFLYISLVQVMSLMLKEVSDRPILQFFIQNIGMLVGWVILLLIALYEGSIQI